MLSYEGMSCCGRALLQVILQLHLHFQILINLGRAGEGETCLALPGVTSLPGWVRPQGRVLISFAYTA